MAYLKQYRSFYTGARSRDDDVIVEIRGEIVKETERALLIDFGQDEPEWFPKSQITDNKHGTFEIPRWLAEEKGAI